MNEKLQQDILALAQNLNDSHFTVLSRGIGLGVERKKLVVGKLPIVEESSPKNISLIQPVNVAPSLPDRSTEKIIQRARVSYSPSFVSRAITLFFTLSVDFIIVLASVISVFVGVAYFFKLELNLDLWLIQALKEQAVPARYVRSIALVLLIATSSYVILFRLLLGKTIGQMMFRQFGASAK